MDKDLESNADTPPMQAPRSRLLLSCGESILAVAESAYRRVEASGCAVGRLARGVSHAAAPVLRPLRPRCLSALSFADRQLAAAQDVAAALCPRAERVLGRVDGFVLLVESLPTRFDGALDGLEALVAGVRGGVAAGFAPAIRACRDGKGAGNVFRDIRCDEEAGGAVHRDVEKIREDAEEMARSDTGSDHFRPSGDETGHGDGAAEAAYGEAAHVDAEKQDAGSDEGKGEGDQMDFDTPGAEQDGRSMEAVQANAVEAMKAMASTGVVKVESQQVASPGAGSTRETGQASGKESNNDGNLLDLFDEAWQLKLA